MKFLIIAESKNDEVFPFTVNAVSHKNAKNKAFKYLTLTLDKMTKRIRCVPDIDYETAHNYKRAYTFPLIKIK